eukprot:m.94706 g.94706  ORF g.94706 m.94706 type:complete len:767 (+) comp8579_c0_seq1:30-2330(+)
MTSLSAALPEPGSILWRAGRAGEDRAGYDVRVRHVLIAATEIALKPRPHVVYFIEVMSHSDQWRVYRRYREFLSLHTKLGKAGIASTLFPGKALKNNFSQDFINHRREMLERYLQRLVNMEHAPEAMQPLLDFLGVADHDPIRVSARLARHLEETGDRLIASGAPFHMTPAQLRCVGRRLHLPRVLPGTPDCSLEALCEFAYQLKTLCVHPMQRKQMGFNPVEAIAVDLSMFRSLECLRVDHCLARMFDAWAHLNGILQRLQFTFAGIDAMEEVFPASRPPRPAPAPAPPGEAWRRVAVERLHVLAVRTHPMVRLQHLDLGFNNITILDGACLELMPAIEILQLPGNKISDFDSWFRKGVVLRSLGILDLSRNCLSSLHCDASHSRTSSFAEPASLPSDMPRGDALWNRDNKLGELRIASVGASVPAEPPEPTAPITVPPAAVPTPENTAPPSYTAPHLLTSADSVPPLDELQRLRAERMRPRPASKSASQPDSPSALRRSMTATEVAGPDSISPLPASRTLPRSLTTGAIGHSPGALGASVRSAQSAVSAQSVASAVSARSDGPGRGLLDPRMSRLSMSTEALAVKEEHAAEAFPEGSVTSDTPDADEASVDEASEASVASTPPRPMRQATSMSSVFTTTSTPVMARRGSPAFSPMTDVVPEGRIRGPMTGLALALLAPSLRELYLAYNLLTSLSGLERLTCLALLDVRHNRLATAAALSALVHLPDLTTLLLEGNPIAERATYIADLRKAYGAGASGHLRIDGQ